MTYRERPLGAFLADVAAPDGDGTGVVTPAGGSTAAVVGAAGAALCEMACGYTARETAVGLTAANDDLTTARTRLVGLADADAAAVEGLLAAPDDDREVELKRAAGVPLAVAEACLVVVDRGATVAADCWAPVAPDAASGAWLAHGALRAAALTTRANLPEVRTVDPAVADGVEARVDGTEVAAADALDRLDAADPAAE